MDSLLREQMTFVAIRRLMQAVLGNRPRGSQAETNGVGVDAAQILNGSGGFYGCFPDPMAWNDLYMRGMNVCPYVDVFWRACHDVGLEFSPVGVIGFDEKMGRYVSSEEVFQQLGARIHFHWGRTELLLADSSSNTQDRAPNQSEKPMGRIVLSSFPVLNSVIASALSTFSDWQRDRSIRF